MKADKYIFVLFWGLFFWFSKIAIVVKQNVVVSWCTWHVVSTPSGPLKVQTIRFVMANGECLMHRSWARIFIKNWLYFFNWAAEKLWIYVCNLTQKGCDRLNKYLYVLLPVDVLLPPVVGCTATRECIGTSCGRIYCYLGEDVLLPGVGCTAPPLSVHLIRRDGAEELWSVQCSPTQWQCPA